MAASNSWIAETSRTYFGNAASRKDFRVQMRGSKPFWVFTLYVLCLTFLGLTFYWSTVGHQGVSVADAQRELTSLFTSLMALLGGAICVIAPGLTGGAIVSERQRLSLDLVLTAPVQPKYLLVGKMISSYRYIWMLLILALPVVAMSVVLGGATWTDVFGCFGILSFHAMIFTSLALFISSVTSKPASAVIWSLLGVGAYVMAATGLYGLSYSGGWIGRSSGASTHETFAVALNPFMPLQAINTTTQVGSWDVPNWIFGVVISLLLTRLFLLAAAVNLAPLDKRLSANLRISGLLYTFAVSLMVAEQLRMVYASAPTSGGPGMAMMISINALGCVFWLFFASPYFACFSNDESRRFKFNGRFSVRHIFDGTPAGNLPFCYALLAASYAGAMLGSYFVGSKTVDREFFISLLWPIGFMVMIWSIGQAMSSVLRTLKTARAITLVALVLPAFFFPLGMTIAGLAPPWLRDTDMSTSGLWYLWPFAPFTSVKMFNSAGIYGLVMLTVGLLIIGWVKSNESRKLLGATNG